MCTGFDKLMPEHRPFPRKYFPKMGVRLGVTFGDPIRPHKITDVLDALRGLDLTHSLPDIAEKFDAPSDRSELNSGLPIDGWMRDAIVRACGESVVEREGAGRARMDAIRSEVTAVIQRAVEDVGRKVSGENLDHRLPQ